MDKKTSLLQETYLQKSRIFLLPLTGLSKDKYFREINTYMCSPDLTSTDYPEGIGFEDKLLIVNYSKSYKVKQDNIYNQVTANFKNISIEETGWDKYETKLMSNKTFSGLHETADELIYTFDLSNWSDDWNFFMKGKYSKISKRAKELVRNYRWTSLSEIDQKKLYCYLYLNEDQNCFKDFAEELGVPVGDLQQIGELCSKPDLKLETFICSKKKELNETKN